MSNPTQLVEAFISDDGAFTSAGAVRFYDGMWLETGTTNLFPNPVLATDATGWSLVVTANRNVTRDISLPAPLPAELASLVTTGVHALAIDQMTGTFGSAMSSSNVTLGSAVPHMCSVYMYIPSSWTGGTPRIGATAFTSATGELEQLANMSTRDQWQRIECGPFTPHGSDLVGTFNVVIAGTGTWNNGQEFWVTGFQIEAGSLATSLAVNTFGTGYSGTTTQIRAASSAALDPTGIIDTYLGAIAFRCTPTIETGVEEVWGELGEKGAGTDHIKWGRDSSKHPFVEWSGNDSAYTRITLDGTVDAGDEHFYSIEWHVGDAIFALYQDALPGESDAIPTPQEDYGGESLTLKASAGGVIYNGILIANERLTDEQRATLLSKENWSMNTLSAPQRRYEFFQLRPGV